MREARRQLEARRWQDPDPIARGRVERLLLAAERMEDDLDAQLAGNRAYERYRAMAVTPRVGISVVDRTRGRA